MSTWVGCVSESYLIGVLMVTRHLQWFMKQQVLVSQQLGMLPKHLGS